MMIVSIIILSIQCYDINFNVSVAVMVGFTYENYTVTEGVDMLTNITVDLDAEIEETVVVRVSTQADSARGTYVCMFNVHTVVNMNEFLIS